MISKAGLTTSEKKEYAFLTANLNELSYEQGKRLSELRGKVIAQRQMKAVQGNVERSTGMKRTPLKQVSKKQASINREYSKLRKIFLSENPVCQVCHSQPSTQVHHKARRGKNTLKVETWMAVDAECHARIEENGQWAREMGYIITL